MTLIVDSETVSFPLVVLQSTGFISPESGENVSLRIPHKLILCYLHGVMPSDGSPLYENGDEIAWKLGIGKTTFVNAMNDLENHWLVETDIVNRPDTNIPIRAVVWVNAGVELLQE